MTNELHAAIMNLPCPEIQGDAVLKAAFKAGHKEARHAAAELVAAARPLPQATLSETLSDEKIKSLAIQHGAFNAGDSRGLILWEHAGFNAGGLFGFARAVLAAARQVAPLPESMSRDEILKYYSDYANMVANEVIGYQKQIRDLKAALAASPSPVGQEEPGHKCGEGVGIVGVKGLDRG